MARSRETRLASQYPRFNEPLDLDAILAVRDLVTNEELEGVVLKTTLDALDEGKSTERTGWMILPRSDLSPICSPWMISSRLMRTPTQ